MIYGVLEIEIMNSIWSLQERNEDANISVSDILSSLSENNIDRAYTTIKTVMDRLVSKDVLVRYRFGKKFFYKSAVDREDAKKECLDTISKQFFDGNYVQMLKFVEKECEQLLV